MIFCANAGPMPGNWCSCSGVAVLMSSSAAALVVLVVLVVLFVVLPLSSTLTAFYIWTLNSLNMTMKDLVERKQHVKAGMYRRLWWCILTTIIVIFAHEDIGRVSVGENAVELVNER